MQNIKCPACGSEDLYLGNENEIKIVCSNCKHIYVYKNGKPVGKILTLLIRIKRWIRTNWSKVQTKIADKVISERTIYTSRCWKCKTPIKAVVSGSTFNKYLGNYLYGNKKCPKLDCKYFICTSCGACLCDGPYSFKKAQKPASRIWVETKLE